MIARVLPIFSLVCISVGCQPLNRVHADPLDSGEASAVMLAPARSQPESPAEWSHHDRRIDRHLHGASPGSEFRGAVGADVRRDF